MAHHSFDQMAQIVIETLDGGGGGSAPLLAPGEAKPSEGLLELHSKLRRPHVHKSKPSACRTTHRPRDPQVVVLALEPQAVHQVPELPQTQAVREVAQLQCSDFLVQPRWHLPKLFFVIADALGATPRVTRPRRRSRAGRRCVRRSPEFPRPHRCSRSGWLSRQPTTQVVQLRRRKLGRVDATHGAVVQALFRGKTRAQALTRLKHRHGLGVRRRRDRWSAAPRPGPRGCGGLLSAALGRLARGSARGAPRSTGAGLPRPQ
mmetsp:Transcript_85513/g.228737  ORF Transcript_85513/g.228737 Transcript_85513/m.228737 type:complete len:261 (-) Transcript_85513:23-805(-)